MKRILLIAGLCACISGAYAQTYMTRTGKVSFNATSKTSPENVEGINNEVACIVDAKTGDVRFQVLIKSFKLEKELMQEHFNENYMESDKYPKSEFSGHITNLNEINFTKNGTYNARVAGKITIHGVTKDIMVPGTITVSGNTVKLSADFKVVLKDYNINIPALVADKVDKEATISVNTELNQK